MFGQLAFDNPQLSVLKRLFIATGGWNFGNFDQNI